MGYKLSSINLYRNNHLTFSLHVPRVQVVEQLVQTSLLRTTDNMTDGDGVGFPHCSVPICQTVGESRQQFTLRMFIYYLINWRN